MNQPQDIEALIDRLAEPISEAISNYVTSDMLPDRTDLMAAVREEIAVHLQGMVSRRDIELTVNPVKQEKELTRLVGWYKQPEKETFRDTEQKPYIVEPGEYAVVASVSSDGLRIGDGGIIRTGVDRESGEKLSRVELHSAKNLRQMADVGSIALERGYSPSMFHERKQEQKHRQQIGLHV